MSKSLLLVLASLAVLHFSCPVAAQPESPISKEYASIVGHDFSHVMLSPFHWQKSDWLRFGIISSAVGLSISSFDTPAEELVQRNRSASTDMVANRFEPFGRNYPSALMIGLYAAGAILKDSTAKLTALDAASASLIASVVVSPLLKFTIGRRRPWANHGPHWFEAFSGSESFPSGHATAAFTLASVMAYHYRRPWAAITFYTVAGLVAWARMDYDVHYFSDVLAGAAIGTAIGLTVSRLNGHLRFRPRST